MDMVQLLAMAASVSILSGWRLYLAILATGIAMRTGFVALPEHLVWLEAMANPWVMGIAGIGAVIEFFADKVAWLDSAWDTVHTVIRPIGGALIAMAIVDAGDPAWQVVAFMLGGGAALLGHGTKAGTRAAVNTSPEPFSNVALSTAEDLSSGGLLALAFAAPVVALVIILALTALGIWLLVKMWRFIRRVRQKPAAVTVIDQPPPDR